MSPDHAGRHAREARIGREDRPRPAFNAHRGRGDEVERDRACGARPRARLVQRCLPRPDGGCGRGGGSRRRCTDVIVNRAARRDYGEVRDGSPLLASRRKEALAILLLGVFRSVMESRVSKAAFATPGAPHQQGAYGDGDGWSESGVADRDSRRCHGSHHDAGRVGTGPLKVGSSESELLGAIMSHLATVDVARCDECALVRSSFEESVQLSEPVWLATVRI